MVKVFKVRCYKLFFILYENVDVVSGVMIEMDYVMNIWGKCFYGVVIKEFFFWYEVEVDVEIYIFIYFFLNFYFCDIFCFIEF